MTTPALPLSPPLVARLVGRPLLLLLDVDGTLAPIAPRPEYAVVPPETKALLRDLAALPNAHVVLISGRSAGDARQLAGGEALWVIGNHGIEIARPNEAPVARNDVAAYGDALHSARLRSEEFAAVDPGVIVEDKRWTLSVHYRLAHPRIVPALIASITEMAADLGLRVTRGKEVLEIRPPVRVDKGTAAVALANQLGALEPGASILCAGDDRTDEDAFRALRAERASAVTVRVGDPADVPDTAAEFQVDDTNAMRELLRAVLASRRTAPGA